MNKYRDKSDFEINKAVAIARGAEPFHNDGFKKSTGYFHKDAVIIKAKFKIGAFDPCNNPADAMPIIFDNNISLILSHNEYPLATNNPSGLFRDALPPENVVTNKNTLRAAMELFLIMKDAENEKV
ncbi:DUF2591 family protein [Morganella morganii subsp. morganii]|uniref:phage protein NinX family protein n=1 Tax=Morganella morganii TaxID=582 RepID=UPI001BDAECC5|nr:phage protein NinX family protein [Morganella morganii]MBT0367300.1 DUF2591 family protein [Morganella morganii subsp. morganii]